MYKKIMNKGSDSYGFSDSSDSYGSSYSSSSSGSSNSNELSCDCHVYNFNDYVDSY